MKIPVRTLPRRLPAFVRRAILVELFGATAAAFTCPPPALDHLSCDECLRAYAQFTRTQADKALASGRERAALKSALYGQAYPLGAKVRKLCGLDSQEAVMAMGRILYGAIGVDLQGNSRGEITVRSCYFSHFYSAPVCDVISALDDGLFSGLSGGSRLVFSERLTEGKACCRAQLQLRSDDNEKSDRGR